MAKRHTVMLLAGILIVASCSVETTDAGSTATPTTAPPAVVGTTTPPRVAPSTTTPTSTTTQPPAAPPTDAVFLVRGSDGVWQVDLEGNAEQLVDGPVAVAVDDTRGGLLYQLDSGRVWDEAEPGSSVVWWIPRGAAGPQELIVPDEVAGQRVTLHDAFATPAGFAVLYTRHDPGSTPDDLVDRLRRINIPGSEVTQVYAQTVWERGFGEIRTNGSLMAGEQWGQVGSACFLLEMDGSTVDQVPDEAAGTEERYVRGCRITTDDELVFFIDDDDTATTTIQIWDLDAEAERHRIDITNAGDWVRDIEAGAGLLVANRWLEGAYVSADVVFLDEPGYPTRQLPVPGQARVARAPIDIAAPIRLADDVARGPSYYRYGRDGVVRMAFGTEERLVTVPVWRMWDDQLGGIIYESERMEKLWLPAGATTPTPLADLDPADEWLMQGEQFFTGVVAGAPTVFYAGYAGNGPSCDGEWQLVGRNLASGETTGFMCLPIGDNDPGVDSIGGDRFVATTWGYSGCSGTGSDIRFFDTAAQLIEVGTNPGAESCAPCDRDALISPDGRLLVHKVRRYTAPQPDTCEQADTDAWWAEQQEQTRLVLEVVDLDSGLVVWTAPDDATGSLIDFDGRYVVVGFGTMWDRTTTIHDTWQQHRPVSVGGNVVLMRSSPLSLHADGLGAASFGDPVDPVVASLTALLGPPRDDALFDPLPDDMAMPHGFAADDYFRFSSWPAIGLSVVFSDADRYRDDGIPHFVAWYATEPVLATTPGLRVGDTVGDLIAAYGDTVALPERFDDECNEGWLFWIGPALAQLDVMNGGLSGDPNDPTTRITYLHAGAHSSC